METINIGLVECSTPGEVPWMTSQQNPKEYNVRKILALRRANGTHANLRYPGVELVDNINSIITDADIELILVSNPKQSDLSLIGEAVQAGKNVRII